MNKLILTLFTLFIAALGYGQNITAVNQLSIKDHTVTLNGLDVEINSDGFLKQIHTFHSQDHTDEGRPLFYEPIHFHYYTTPKTQIKLNPLNFNLTSSVKDSITWDAVSSSEDLKQEIYGEILANGLVKYKIRVTALKDVRLASINFHIPFEKSTAKYLTGLNQRAGLRPDTVKWNNNNDKTAPVVWIGDEKQGLYLSLFNKKDFENANTKNGWINEGKGKLQINVKGSSMLFDFNTEKIDLKEGEELSFDCNLILSQAENSKKVFNPSKKFKGYRKLEKSTK